MVSSQMASLLIYTVTGLAAVPLFLSHWGAETYALWLVSQAVADLALFLDAKLQPWVANGLAMAQVGRRSEEYQRVGGIATSLYLWVLLSGHGLAAMVWLWGSVPVDGAAGAEAGAGGLASWLAEGGVMLALLGPMILIHAWTLVGGAFGTLYRAHDRPDLGIWALILRQLAMFMALVVALLLGAGPMQLAIVLAVVHAVLTLWVAWDVRRRYGHCLFRPVRPTPQEWRVLMGQAGMLNLHSLALYGLVQGPVLLLGRGASEAALILFTTMRTLVGLVRQIAVQLAVGPAMERARAYARRVAQQQQTSGTSAPKTGALADQRGAVLTRSTLWIGLALLAFGLGGLAVFGAPVHGLWTGGAVAFDPVVLWLLLAWVGLSGLGSVMAQVFQLTNRPGRVALWQTVGMLVTIAICWLGVEGFGPQAAALALLMGEGVITGPVLVAAALRDNRAQAPRPSRTVSHPGVAALLLRALGLLLLSLLWAAVCRWGLGLLPGLSEASLGVLVLEMLLWGLPMGALLLFVLTSPARRRLWRQRLVSLRPAKRGGN
ncbi:MAG: lipopolysaccharide biosynthesis protein [Rhodospirillaceae bacterium]